MESSGDDYPSTSERARRSHGPNQIAHEERALSGHFEQEGGSVVRSYERWFLELPVAGVLALMWLAGAVLLGSGALALYLLGSSLLRILN